MIRYWRYLSIIIILSLIGFLVSCSRREFPRPTKEFYVNDFANVFSSSLKHFLIHENERLYDDVDDDGNKPGAQIVYATFVVKTVEEEANLRGMGGVDLFNEWRIGKNDLGVLVLFIYMEKEEGDAKTKSLTGHPVILTGYQLDQYLVPSKIDQILASTLETDEVYEIGIMHLMCEILSIIYVDIYGYNSFDYDMEQLEDIYYNYHGTDYGDSISMSLIFYLLSGHSTLGEKLLSLLPFALVFIISGGLVFNKGGGGLSGGTGFFRRRR